MSKNTRNRILLTAVAALLLVTMAVGGTLAWLQDKTDPVVNKFTPSDINVKLEETLQSDGEELAEGEEWSAQLIPGVEYDKDPKVTVEASAKNVASYLFVKVSGMDSAATYLEDINYFFEKDATNWKALDATNYPGVYYRALTAEEAIDGYTVYLIDGNKVTVKDELKKDVLENASFELSFQAWIIQQAGFENNETGAYDAAVTAN